MAAVVSIERRLALILLAIVAARLAALYGNRTDLFFDEAQYWTWAQEPAFGYYSKPPLIAWLIGATTALCGDTEACIRSASPVLHALTAWVIFLTGRRLYDARAGFWSAIVYATLPGVSVSTTLISTDVPFLFLWALALWGFVRLRGSDAAADALLLGGAIGVGFLARYSMAFFVGSMLVALWVERRAEKRVGWRRWAIVAVAALLVLSPNIAWNIANGFATLGHTADNAKWAGSLVHPMKALEFFGAQFGVFGPILFGALAVIALRASRRAGRDLLTGPDRLLLAFAAPIILVYVGQAFLSRAHANWAAAGYIAATILVTATMLREAPRLFRISLGLHGALAAVIALAPAFAGRLPIETERDPFRRLLGWRELAHAVRDEVAASASAGRPYASILVDDRGTLAEMLYYLRDLDTPVRAWRSGPAARDHYELTRAYAGETPTLLVVHGAEPKSILSRFGGVERRLARGPQAQGRDWRALELYRLERFESTP
jgi:4-amino-4-deoxy-L-arabinose transferase-like glycosyltransferase